MKGEPAARLMRRDIPLAKPSSASSGNRSFRTRIARDWHSAYYMIKDASYILFNARCWVCGCWGAIRAGTARSRSSNVRGTGPAIYFEEGVRQSQATPDGESVFTYVKLMDELLSRSANILVLGCGGGNLATRLARLGKTLTIVDNNPISFVIAHKFFGLPDDLACMVSDFRKFIYQDDALYDGIAIDIGGPGFPVRR